MWRYLILSLFLIGCDTTLNKNEVINLSCAATRSTSWLNWKLVEEKNYNYTFSMSINKSNNTISTSTIIMGDYKNLRESELEYFASKENGDYITIDRTTLRFSAAQPSAKKDPILKGDVIFWGGSCRKSDKI